MSSDYSPALILGGFCAVAFALGAATSAMLCKQKSSKDGYSIADQPARFARDKAANNPRVMDIDSVYNPDSIKGKTVLITGQFCLLQSCEVIKQF